jgi:hypothetical protein
MRTMITIWLVRGRWPSHGHQLLSVLVASTRGRGVSSAERSIVQLGSIDTGHQGLQVAYDLTSVPCILPFIKHKVF